MFMMMTMMGRLIIPSLGYQYYSTPMAKWARFSYTIHSIFQDTILMTQSNKLIDECMTWHQSPKIAEANIYNRCPISMDVCILAKSKKTGKKMTSKTKPISFNYTGCFWRNCCTVFVNAIFSGPPLDMTIPVKRPTFETTPTPSYQKLEKLAIANIPVSKLQPPPVDRTKLLASQLWHYCCSHYASATYLWSIAFYTAVHNKSSNDVFCKFRKASFRKKSSQ